MARLLRILLWASGLVLACSEPIQEAPKVQLASELNVGFELVSRCSTLQYESAERCSGRKPFTQYGDAKSGCSIYYWCSPEHAACMMVCQAGSVFNQACNCCQDYKTATAAAFDFKTCSATAKAAEWPHDEAHPATRKLLDAEAGSSSSDTGSSSSRNSLTPNEEALRIARAKARIARRKRREAALQAAAESPTGAKAADLDLDSISSNSSMPLQSKRRISRRTSRPSEWNAYGKRYSGRWASRNVVKEPAVRVVASPAPAADAAAVAAASVTAAGAVPDTPTAQSATAAGTERKLMDNAAAVEATASPISSESPVAHQRSVKMKRVQRLAAQAAAAAAAAGDPAETAATADAIEQQYHGGEHHKFNLRQKMRPMDKKPAAKAIDPADEAEAPFAQALTSHS